MLAHELTNCSLLDLLDGLQKKMEEYSYKKNALVAGRKYLEHHIKVYKSLFDSVSDVARLTIRGINQIISALKLELRAIKIELGRL
jgi:hypothetical protein